MIERNIRRISPNGQLIMFLPADRTQIAVAGLPSVPPAVWGHDQPARTEGAQVKRSGHSLGCFEMLRFPKMGVPPNHPVQ